MTRYMGNPCKKGHSGEKFTNNRNCCECAKERQKAWWEKNPEKKLLLSKRSAENRDQAKKKAGMKKWCENNKEKRREYKKRWYEANAQHVKEPKILYFKNNPQVKRISEAKRRAAKRGSSGGYTAKDIEKMYAAQKCKCASCFCKIKKYHVDHIMPLSKRGSNELSNIQLLCQPCNQRKSARLPEEWARINGRLL